MLKHSSYGNKQVIFPKINFKLPDEIFITKYLVFRDKYLFQTKYSLGIFSETKTFISEISNKY